MANQVEICNSALTMIGTQPIMSLDDGNEQAKLCKNHIGSSQQIVLRAHRWNCATKRVILAPLVTTPAFEYSNEFQLPAQCLKVLKIDPSINTAYRIEGTLVRADSTQLELIYIEDPLAKTEDLDSMCAESISAYLAWKICYALRQSTKLREQLFTDYHNTLRTAKSMDAKEDSMDTMTATAWDDSRRANYTGIN